MIWKETIESGGDCDWPVFECEAGLVDFAQFLFLEAAYEVKLEIRREEDGARELL